MAKIDARELKSLSFQRPDYESLIQVAIRQIRSANSTDSTNASSAMLTSNLNAIADKMSESDDVYVAIKKSLAVKTEKIGKYVRQNESSSAVLKRLLGDDVIDKEMVEQLVNTIDTNVRELHSQQKLILKQHKVYGKKMNTRILAKLGVPIALLNQRIENKTKEFDDSLAGRVDMIDASFKTRLSDLDKKKKLKPGTAVLGVTLIATFISGAITLFVKGSKND